MEADNPFAAEFNRVDRVRLIVRNDRVLYECKIVRRDKFELGLRFVAAPKPITKMSR